MTDAKKVYPKEYLKEVLNSNQHKRFVQRINDPNRKSLKNKDGTHSTHSMAWGEANGKFLAFPTVVEHEGGLKRLSNEDAWNNAIKNKESIEFKTAEEAAWFSENYKSLWGDK